MRTLTDHEKRTVRIGAILLALYLVIFCGLSVAKRFQARRDAYRQLLRQAQDVRDEIQPYQDKAEVVKKLIDTFHLDPMTLSRTSLVAQASAAIQKAAAESGVAPGPIRETPAHGTGKEMASIQFEGTGPVSAVMKLLYRLQATGSPLVVDSVQMGSDPHRPGAIKLNLTIVVLDFEQWKTEGAPDA
jgi:DNA polymerase III alpha subunit